MFFRNLTLFRFPTSLDFNDLDARLDPARLKPVGPLALSSRGFVPPLPMSFAADGGDALSHRVGDAIWLTVGGEDKLLPAAVVNDLLAKKLVKLEQAQGRMPHSRARRRLKEELVHELLPRAFVRPLRVDALLDLEHGLCVVDTASRKKAEAVVGELRHALGSFPALPVNAETAPRAVLTGWIAGEPLPAGLSLGDECELKDAADRGAVVKCQRQELTSQEIGKHLEAGKQVTRLALTLDDRLSFVLGEDLVLRKLKLLHGEVEPLHGSERVPRQAQDERDELRAELEVRFALLAGEIKRLFAVLAPALRMSRADA